MDHEKIKQAVRMILEAVGEDPDREGLLDTPRRVADMYEEILAGIGQDPGRFLDITFEEHHKEMVVLQNIPLHSLCEHHMLPFFGRVHIGYIPRGRIVGVSKLARLTDMLSKRLQVQERLTSQIADALQERLNPLGCGVVVEAEHLCYDRRTEVLTPEGWVRFDELRPGVEVAQVDPETLEMSFTAPTAYVRYLYEGEMIHWRSKNVDLLVTPDHRMVFKSEWAFVTDPASPWTTDHAANMPARFYVPQAVYWPATDVAQVELGGQVISGDDYARFMGAWLSEGCTRVGKHDVVISQNIGAFEESIWALLQQLPFRFHRFIQANRPQHIHFVSTARQLHEALKPFGKSGDKYVPTIIKAMSARQIKLFLDWFAMGDGHRYRHAPLRIQYVSKSARLIDDIQELMLRVGQTASTQQYTGHSRIEIRTHKQRLGAGYKWYGKLIPRHRTTELFNDEVFCVSVPKGALLVRRNGRPVVSGNCMVMRGIQRPGSRMVTSAMRGLFRDNPSTRTEFLSIIHHRLNED